MEKSESNPQKWLSMIADYERSVKQWESSAKKIIDIYRDHDTSAATGGLSSSKFNILWANVQTVLPAVFARLPEPDVSRRFRDNDPVGRVAALILERALGFEIHHHSNYRSAMENSILDRFLGGRGTIWGRYEPKFKTIFVTSENEEEDVSNSDPESSNEDDSEAEKLEDEIEDESAPIDYVHWQDFGHSIARTWEEVTSVWRKIYLGRDALIQRFGEEVGATVPLDTKPDEDRRPAQASSESNSDQACIYELWDKPSNKAFWISKSMGKILDERENPLELEEFFPCPRPLFSTLTTDSLIPIPDYKLYQDQAIALNQLSDRIDGLIRALKVRGIYDASVPVLSRLFSEGENNSLLPVQNWQAFAEKNGLKGAIDIVDIMPIATALNEAYKAMEFIKNEIYEIMGISDILRGSAELGETATAQSIKAQFGGLRLRAMQEKVARFATEALQIKAQIMCKFFQPNTLLEISAAQQLSPEDQQMIPAALEMLKNKAARGFRIEIASDSLVQMDEVQEKQDRLEFLKATGDFLQNALPVVQSSPMVAPLILEMLKFGVTAFKVGKGMEGQFDMTADQLLKQSQQPQKPAPNPILEKIQAQAQVDQQELQLKAQLDQQQEAARQQYEVMKLHLETQIEQQRAQADIQIEQQKQALQAQQVAMQNQIEAQRQAADAQQDAILEQMRQQFELMLKRLDNANKIEIAEINKSAKLEEAQMAAANAASQNEIPAYITNDNFSGNELTNKNM